MKHPMGRVFHSKNIFSKFDIFGQIGYFYVSNRRFEGKNRRFGWPQPLKIQATSKMCVFIS